MYASYDSTAAQPTPVTGWFDAQTPAMLSVPSANILALTQQEWDNRLTTPYVSAGILVATPMSSPAQLLAAAKAVQNAVITTACAVAITGGVVSSALGSPYTYPTKPTDQVNLTANVVGSLMPASQTTGWTTPQMCLSSAGVWAYVAHSNAQIQQVGNDVKTAIASLLVKKNSLLDQIAAATTVTAVEAVIW